MNLFTLQFEWHLHKNHEFHVEYLLWYNRIVDDPVRNYTGIWELVHDFVRRKKDFANRKQSMKDHLLGMAGFLSEVVEEKALARTRTATHKCASLGVTPACVPRKTPGRASTRIL